MAPTSSEMPAMAPTAIVITSITLPKTSSIASWVVTVKSSSPWRSRQHPLDLGLDTRRLADVRVHQVDLEQLVLVEEPERARHGHDRDVVDVEAHHLALGLHHPDHAEAPAGDPHQLAERASLAEQLARQLGPQHGDRAAAARVALRPERALARAELPERRQVGCRAEHRDAAAALAGLDARQAHRDRHHRRDARDAGERLRVVDRELARGAAEDAGDAERLRLARVDGDDVGAELGELAEHVDARALADRGQQDHRGDADRDAQHREERAQRCARSAPSARRSRSATAHLPASAVDRVEPRRAPGGQHAEHGARPRPRARTRRPRPTAAGKPEAPGRSRPAAARRHPAEQRGPAGRPPRRSGSPPSGRRPGSGRRPAPSAFSRPTSRVRSETETSITFMIPTPATASETAAMPPSAMVSAPMIEPKAEMTASWVITVTSSSPWRSREHAQDGLLGAPQVGVAADLDHQAEQPRAVEHLHRRRDRHDHDVVHVEPELLAARLEDADHAHAPVADAHHLADGVAGGEQLLRELACRARRSGAPRSQASGGRKRPCAMPRRRTSSASCVAPKSATCRCRSPKATVSVPTTIGASLSTSRTPRRTASRVVEREVVRDAAEARAWRRWSRSCRAAPRPCCCRRRRTGRARSAARPRRAPSA